MQRIEKVTAVDIVKLAADKLDPGKFAIASVGPWGDCIALKEAANKVG